MLFTDPKVAKCPVDVRIPPVGFIPNYKCIDPQRIFTNVAVTLTLAATRVQC